MTDETSGMKTFTLTAERTDNFGSLAHTHGVDLILDTSANGRPDAANPMELMLASLAACMLKGIERHSPALQFKLRGASISLTARRPEKKAQVESIEYLIVLETDESDSRLELMHKNLLKHGTMFNTLKHGTDVFGRLERGVT